MTKNKFSVGPRQAVLLCLALLAYFPLYGMPVTLPLRVNCGGGTITDEKTNLKWLSDKEFALSGTKYRFKQEPKTSHIDARAPAKVYQYVRRGEFLFVFGDLPDGVYQLRLHFMDGKTKGKARRSMDFRIEGASLIQNLDLHQATGGTNRAYVREIIVQVKDQNGLEIRGSRGDGDDAVISAIEIHAAPVGSVPATAPDMGPHAPADQADQLRRFAGGPVRLVWARSGINSDYYQRSASGQLYGYDTEDGKGERCILPQIRSYAMPLLTPDGGHVIFTDYREKRCYEVAFDGSGLRELVAGYASDVWQDPVTNVTWVYVRTGWGDTKAPIRRYRLDDVTQSELVWDAAPTGQDTVSWFQVSADGRRAAEGFPWPKMGVADIAARDFKVIGAGCWPAIAPDESQRLFYFLGVHTAIEFFDEPTANPRTIDLATIPGWTGRKLYHPRWTNDVRFISATAPQWLPVTELYLGRFDAGFTKIENWFRVSYNDSADFFGDALVGKGSKHPSPNPPAKPVPSVVPKDAHVPGLVFVWENGRSKNAIIGKDGQIARAWSCGYVGESRPNRWFGADLRAGALVPDPEAGGAVSQAVRASGELTLSMDLTPYTTKPEADGVIAFLGSADGREQFIVEQHGGALQVTISTTEADEARAVKLANLDDTRSRHWVMTVQNGFLRGYLDGKPVMERPLRGGIREWNSELLIFGRDGSGKRSWRGGLEGIAIHDRSLTAQDVQTLYTQRSARWLERKPAPLVEVEAELIQSSKPADPKIIAPYVRSLAENHYRVKQVLGGTLEEKEIIVLQWAILGGKALPSALREKGKVQRLMIEPVESHPELNGEHRSTDIFEPTLPVYYDIES